MTDQEKAAIGYVYTSIGNECWWDAEANDDRSNLDCKIITALGLVYIYTIPATGTAYKVG